MKLFGKEFSRKEWIKIALLIFGMCVVVSVPVMASFGWFSNIQKNTKTGNKMTVRTGEYDLLVERPLSERYDESLTDEEGDSLYPGMETFKTKIESDGYSLSATSTANDNLAFELINEYPDLDGSYNLRPGSYGTVSFYLRPHEGMDGGTVTFRMNLSGYYGAYDAEDNLEIYPVTNERAINILKGHILFFTERTGASYADYAYDGLIDNGSFQYDMSQHSKSLTVGKTDCYYITLYWEWPITYDEILDTVGVKYPTELSDYISDYPEYFFASNQNSVDRQRLNDGYNDGDQIICDGVNYIAVRIE